MKGIVIGVLTAALLLGICSILLAGAILPETGMDGSVLVCCAAGALIGGLSAVKGRGRQGVLWGVCTGGAMAAVLGVSGFLLYSNLDVPWCAAVFFTCACAGGVAGALRGGKGRRHK